MGDWNWLGPDSCCLGSLESIPAGKGEEQALAAAVLGLLCVQLGPGPKGEELFHSLQPLLVSVLSDGTASPAARLHVSVSCPVTPFAPLIPKQRGGFHLP